MCSLAIAKRKPLDRRFREEMDMLVFSRPVRLSRRRSSAAVNVSACQTAGTQMYHLLLLPRPEARGTSLMACWLAGEIFVPPIVLVSVVGQRTQLRSVNAAR